MTDEVLDEALIEKLGGLQRYARLMLAITWSLMIWEIDYEIWHGEKPSAELVEQRRAATCERYLTPGVMWPGIDFL